MASTSPVFNRSRFQALTLHDEGLQADLLAAFFHEVEDLRRSVAAAAPNGAEAFRDAVHRVRSTSHFVGGDRLFGLATEIERGCPLRGESGRSRAARRIVGELSALEQALAEDRGRLRRRPVARAECGAAGVCA